MWVPQQLPEIAGPLREAGLRLAPEQLADLTGDPMGAVVSLGGCTASFVSPGGLVATNHHCAYGAIQLNSTPENNLMQAGFYAPEQGAELSAGPNARIFVLDTIRDVTFQVQNAIAAAPDPIGRARALEFIEKRLVADCEHEDGYSCRLYSFSGGNEYRLFRNLEIRDVRLVYAPPGGIGNFGGEVDNWMWPRHTGDFAFYRAYVGPDGKPADHAEENVPYEPRHWLRFSDRPLRDGDFVMAAGYPGRTNRYALVAEFEQTEQWTYPIISRHYKALIELVEAQGRENPEIAVRYAATMGGWRNTSKNYDGQLEGFARIDAAARKSAEEAAVLEWLNAQGESGRQALDAYAELVEIAGEAAVMVETWKQQMDAVELTPAQKEAVESLRKFNLLAFRTNQDNMPEYELEKEKVNQILKGDEFVELMKIKSKYGNGVIKYLGDEDAIDEVIIFGDQDSKGFALIRVLGNDMNPAHIMELMQAIQKSDYKGEGLGEIGEFLKG